MPKGKWKKEDVVDFWTLESQRKQGAEESVEEWNARFPDQEFFKRRSPKGNYHIYSKPRRR